MNIYDASKIKQYEICCYPNSTHVNGIRFLDSNAAVVNEWSKSNNEWSGVQQIPEDSDIIGVYGVKGS